METYPILVVDDLPEYRQSMEMLLESEGHRVWLAGDISEAMSILESEDVEIVLTDLLLGKENGIQLLSRIKALKPDVEVIVLSAFATVESAVEAMKKGAYSYYIKSDDPSTLLRDVDRIIEMKRLRRENQELRSGRVFLESKNPAFRRLMEMAERIASSTISVLILGESGVGKEVIARHIHDRSLRREGAFVPVHCQMFSKGLLESELFGHERGSFTGATSQHIGKFERAHGGTLFLDELGEMDESTQVKLLRVLEDKQLSRLGSSEPKEINFRLISATNSEEVEGKIQGVREDLYYRLSGIVLRVPALRERAEDIPELVRFFLYTSAEELNKPIDKMEEEAMELLCQYHYPGNVRELRNIIKRLVVLSDHQLITKDDVLLHVPFEQAPHSTGLREARKIFEKKHIAAQLQSQRYDLDLTAEALGITRRQLSNKLTEYNLRGWLHRRLEKK
ncbi:MAG TPA: sigma-54-dependent Fis family transcriptional regulator [Tissierellia bacterium]|jgi:two-component system response regulator HydG|nr:sigma-54-dependent Fis family transcriptional regulator [Tissierellia bacterium]